MDTTASNLVSHKSGVGTSLLANPPYPQFQQSPSQMLSYEQQAHRQPEWNQPTPQAYGQLSQPQYGNTPLPNYVPPQQQSQWSSYQQPLWLGQQFQPMPTKPPKKGFFNKKIGPVPLWVIILALGIILIPTAAIASMGNTSTTGNTSPDASSNNTANSVSTIPTSIPTYAITPIPTDIPTTIPTPTQTEPSKVGGTITVNGVSCILVSVKFLPDDGIVVPNAGDEFVVVHVKLINNSGSDFNYYSIDFKGKSGSGNAIDSNSVPPSTYTANNLISFGTLSPGGTVEGDVVLEVPIGDHKAELVWQPGIDSTTTDNVWNLGL